MRGRALRVLGISAVLFVVVEIASCRIYDTFVMPADPDGLVRREIAAPNGITVSYLGAVAGMVDLPRLIYIHGTPGDATAFERYLLNAVPGFESLSVDRPGFGYTRPKELVASLVEQARCLQPLLVKRGGRGTILVGHSLGGAIAVEAALDYPDLVGGLVIIAGSLDPSLEYVAWYQRLAEFAIVPYMLPGALRMANREVISLKAELEVLRPRLMALRCPVAIVHAPDDILVPAGNVEYMLREFPLDRVVDVIRPEGKNHFVPWNDEADVRRAIERVAAAMNGRQPRPAEVSKEIHGP
jgi:pimeloyl-ACP methyl ester carboxylesterase